MWRLRNLGMAALLVTFALPAHAGGEPTIDQKVAKTQARAFALGTVTPPDPGGSVRVRLWRDGGSGSTLLQTRYVRLSEASDEDGDGSEESTFEARFDRPARGRCRFVARYRSGADPGSAAVRSTEDFPCAIPEFDSGTALITSDSGLAEFDVEIAETPEQQGYGLMYRRWMAVRKGMVFLFPGGTNTSFYMKNTLIPLSIAFYDKSGMIVRILDMEPCDDDPCPLYDPGTTYYGALEVNQGAFAARGIGEGDIVQVNR